MLWPAPAFACDDRVLAVMPPVAEAPVEPAVASAHTTRDGEPLAGARVVMRSEAPVSAWETVLQHPESQDDWLPREFGVSRVERLDTEHVFEQIDLPFVFGTLHVRRQVVIDFDWREAGTRFRNCWVLAAPEPWLGRVASWKSDAPWQRVGLGSWTVDPLPDGASRVSYEFWTEADLLPGMEAWAMSRTLPDLVRAFDARAKAIAGS